MSERDLKVIVLDYLASQLSDKKLEGSGIKKQILKEFITLHEQEEQNSIYAYLKNQNGKPMKGAENIYKYRLNSGDRILYTYGQYIPFIRETDCLVLLGYSKHDDQGHDAKYYDLKKEQGYWSLQKITKVLQDIGFVEDEFTTEEISAVVNILEESLEWHAAYVIKDEEYTNLSADEMEVYLTDEQDRVIRSFIEEQHPVMVQGGAGTGKTLIAVHALHDYLNSIFINDDHIMGVYFTQSLALRERVQKIYKGLADGTDERQPEFYDINDFCIDKLGFERKNFVRLPQFIQFLENTKLADLCRKNGIDLVDAWTEIRGTVKGAMKNGMKNDTAKSWRHCKTYLSQDTAGGKIEKAVMTGYFERNKDKAKQKEYCLAQPLEETLSRLKADNELDETSQKIVGDAIQYYGSFDPFLRTLEKDVYRELDKESSTLDTDKRKVIWIICERYEEYLKENGFFDDNDLVREMFRRFGENNLPQFDIVVTDEIQDYTELQIYLLYTLAKNKNRICFVGDSHQNVNPTHFREKRLKQLFSEKSTSKPLEFNHLAKNFRCQQKIVDLANRIAESRRTKIAKLSEELEQPETSNKKNNMGAQSVPLRLKYSEDNLRAILFEVTHYPRVAVLVPDERTREEAIKEMDQALLERGKGTYDTLGMRFIFTVPEIKGMEYAYVVCLNLIHDYRKEWETIMAGDSAKKQTKYRYYYNLLYVAATRAQDHICFIDNVVVPELENVLKLKTEEQFAVAPLNFLHLLQSDSEWLRYALDLEANGNYADAASSYERGHGDAVDIYRCRMYIAEEKNDFPNALRYCLLCGKMEFWNRYTDALEEGPFRQLGELIRILISGKTVPKNARPLELVQDCFREEQERAAARIRVLKYYNDAIAKTAQKFTEFSRSI